MIDNVLKKEIDLLMEDIIEVYEKSGKKVTGQFAEGLDPIYSNDGEKVELFGYPYLAGRRKGKMPPVQEIEKWVVNKGIASLGVESSGIAWAISKKIAEEGTDNKSHLPIYELVLNAERMDSIIEKVSQFHLDYFVNEVTTRIMMISQKYQK
jgi:hypothetical protein